MSFDRFIYYMVWIALASAFVETYLSVNKIWIRKHERAVAESQSLAANFLALITEFPFLIKFALAGDVQQVIQRSLTVGFASFAIMVGAGVWVADAGKRSFWAKLKAALRLEGREVGDLAKGLFRPTGAKLILRILHQVALIDRKLDEREKSFIEAFARQWTIDYKPEELVDEAGQDGADFVSLRQSVVDYISLKPPTEQAAELRDLLDALAKIDKEVAPEEQLILDELLGMLNAYALPDGATAQTYRVVLVPQGAAQDDAIKSLLPAVAKTEYRGGEAYVAGSYFSGNYASMICRRYRAMNLFTIVDRSEPASASN